MKKLKIAMSFVAFLLVFTACSKDFLDRHPLDQVGEQEYFKSPKDLETYLNQFYNSNIFVYANETGLDSPSDNAVASDPLYGVGYVLSGNRTLDGAGVPDFSLIRSVNYFFDNYKRVEANNALSTYQQYVGEAHFFRALFYFDKLKHFGAIQWYIHDLKTNSPELTAPRDPRNVVADNIIADLDSAATMLSEDKTDGESRINKWMAFLIQSRIALYEGTWEKYHADDAFGVTNADPAKYFNKAAAAAQQLMNSGLYQIYSTGNPTHDFYDVFTQRDYSSHPEIMFWRKFDNNLANGSVDFRRQINYMMQFPYGYTNTRELADSYLCTDGKPISVSPLFQGHTTIAAETQNRDPRFYQTIGTPDQPWEIHQDGSIDKFSLLYSNLNSNSNYFAPTGYFIRKYYDAREIYHIPQYEDTPGIIYRYAEALLNFAEAKAESGTIAQADIDQSIKILRDRAGMPNLVLADITTDPDWDFPTLSPAINEIRRERRIELADEGFRFDDIMRWAAADELIVGKRPRGFLASQIALNPYPVDVDGYLDPFALSLPDGWQFKLDRDYLDAINKSELLLNPNLIQNPGWGE